MFAQKISYTCPKKRFSNEGNFLHPPERTDFFHKEKISQAYPKNTNFRNENNFFNYRKNDFLNKTFLIRDWKTVFIYFCHKVKEFHFRCIFNSPMLFFYARNTNKIANLNISKSLFVKRFCPSIFYIIFFYTQLNFVFHILGGFYIVCDHIAAFSERSGYLSLFYFIITMKFLRITWKPLIIIL